MAQEHREAVRPAVNPPKGEYLFFFFYQGPKAALRVSGVVQEMF